MAEARKKYFSELRDIFQGQKIIKQKLHISLEEIQIMLSFRGGLSNDELMVLVELLCNNNLVPALIDDVVKCIIPKETISDDILNMCLVAIFSKRRNTTNIRCSKVLLQWLLSVLDFGFAQEEIIQDYYDLFYRLLEFNELNAYTCKMIYKLTKPLDVNGIKIKKLTNLCTHQKISSTQYVEALLRYFKSYNPIYNDTEISTDNKNVATIFENLPQKSSHLFSIVHRTPLHRDMALVPMIGLQNTIIDEEVHKPQVQVKEVNRLMPMATYTIPPGKGCLSILGFDSIEQLGSKVVVVAIPNNILSLLNNEVGHFKLLTCDESDQSMFAVRLLHTLQKIFVEKDDVSSVEEKESFLVRIYDLCNFIQQGIHECTTFIRRYLQTWSGQDYCTQIFHLIEWTMVDSYSELFPILKSLYTLFVTTDTAVKCCIIDTLTNLVGNMAKHFRAKNNGISLHFIKSKTPTWLSDPIPMFQKTIEFIENLIQIGLCVEPEERNLLHSSVSFYEDISQFEDICELPLFTVVQKGVVYRCLFNNNINFMNHIAGLLIKYQELYNRLVAAQLHLQYTSQLELCKLYVNDILNIAWHGEAITRRDGIISDLLTENMISKIYRIDPNPNRLFAIHNHISILSVCTKMRAVGENMSPAEICNDQEKLYDLLQSYAPNIAKLVDLANATQICENFQLQ